MTASTRRYEALDSLRGLCACLVALFHFPTAGTLTNLALVRNGWLFVDFFFVLSGFVIGAAYWDRLRGGYPAWKYVALRLGRIWPLHLFVLGLFVALELALAAGFGGPAVARGAFGPGHSPIELAATTLLLNAHGLFDHLSWNNPSWSIGAEFSVYLVFALLLGLGGRKARWLFAGAAVLAFAILALHSPKWLDATYELGVVRCLFGFSLGVLLHPLVVRLDSAKLGRLATPLEIATVIACCAFVAAAQGAATLLAPILFAFAIYVFSCEAGLVSRLLRTRPLLLVGTLSYSIYLLHAFVQGRFVDLLEYDGNAQWGRLIGKLAASRRDTLGDIATWPADLAALLMLALVIGLAWLSYRFVELPGRRWTRVRINGNGATDAAEARAPTF